MENKYQRAQKLDEKSLKRRLSRRDFLKSSGKSITTGMVTGGLCFLGLDYAGKRILGVVCDAEKEIKKLGLDIKALSGSLERKLASETEALERHYTNGKLGVYEELGIATPAEISEFEKIIEDGEEFEAHYIFAERAREFKDRIDRRLLSLDDVLESKQPGFMRSINDTIRSALGKKSGTEGQAYRTVIKQRLTELCKIYDANEDNKTAEVQVLRKLNDYIEHSPQLIDEEKDLLEFLRDQYKKEGSKEHLKNFIKNYETNSDRNETLLKLRASLSESERLYGAIQDNKKYLTRLQTLLKDGIELKQKIRERVPEEFETYRKQIEEKVNGLRGSVDEIIGELKTRGYDIETREDFVNKKGIFSSSIESIVRTVESVGSLSVGALATGLAYLRYRRNAKQRVLNSALKEAVRRHNDLADSHNNLIDNIEVYSSQSHPTQNSGENYKNTPEYSNDRLNSTSIDCGWFI